MKLNTIQAILNKNTHKYEVVTELVIHDINEEGVDIGFYNSLTNKWIIKDLSLGKMYKIEDYLDYIDESIDFAVQTDKINSTT